MPISRNNIPVKGTLSNAFCTNENHIRVLIKIVVKGKYEIEERVLLSKDPKGALEKLKVAAVIHAVVEYNGNLFKIYKQSFKKRS